ncbi:MAG: hypothetical protein MRZ45_07240 [Blautia sp.]|nr:hypothetical protein [Blautia sp.]
MRKTKGLILVCAVSCLLAGCSRFSPKETAVSVSKDGKVTAAVIDKLDQSYYDAEELKENIDQAVSDYNGSAGEDTVTVQKFETREEGDVKLFMEYASGKDYAAFNNVDFYVGDITDGYNNAGYRFETTFRQVEKGKAVGDEIAREEIFAGSNHPMLVFSEPMAVEVPGRILYVSSNVEVTGKKSARMAGSRPETETETETEGEDSRESGSEDEVQEIAPSVEITVTGGESEAALAYIIYE